MPSSVVVEGVTRTEDLINNLPQAFGDFGGNVSNGATGAATVNLRNLGSQRTLVLVNSRRLMPGDPTQNGAASPDLNQIPALLVERAEVITGGASAQWGSDAVAGVVNIILRKKYSGFQLTAQTGFSTYGDGLTKRIGALGGVSLMDDRLHIVAALDFSESDKVGDIYTRPWGAREYQIVANSAGAITGFAVEYNELTVHAQTSRIVDVMSLLRDNPQFRFQQLMDVTAVDYPGRANRFDVVWHFLSPTLNERIRLRGQASETTQVPSIIREFPGADWFERETYDLYGVIFTGHPDMRRLLTDYGFDGHPLRKDFPTTGFVEVRYDDAEKRVVYEPVQLNQEFRRFDFLSPWEGADYPLPGDEKAEVKPAPKAGS